MASTLLGSGEMPLPENTNPKNGLLNSHFLVSQCQVDFCKLLKHCCKCSIVISLCLSKDDDIIIDVQCSRYIADHFIDGILGDFTCGICSEAGVPP